MDCITNQYPCDVPLLVLKSDRSFIINLLERASNRLIKYSISFKRLKLVAVFIVHLRSVSWTGASQQQVAWCLYPKINPQLCTYRYPTYSTRNQTTLEKPIRDHQKSISRRGHPHLKGPHSTMTLDLNSRGRGSRSQSKAPQRPRSRQHPQTLTPSYP